MGRKILFITTTRSLQRRLDRPPPGRRPPRGRRHQLPAGTQPEHGVHSGTFDDDHRSVRAHPRRLRQRVPLPVDAPSVAAYLHEEAGYRTALLGKAHFEPAFDRKGRWFENRMAGEGSTGPFPGAKWAASRRRAMSSTVAL